MFLKLSYSPSWFLDLATWWSSIQCFGRNVTNCQKLTRRGSKHFWVRSECWSSQGFLGGLVVKNLPACQPVRDTSLIPRSEGWSFQEVFVRLMAFLTLILHLHPSLFFKRTWHPNPMRWLFWDISLPSFQSASFQNEIIFLASTAHVWIYWLIVQNELGLGSSFF